MTRRLTESVYSSRPRSPNVLPIGHLSNKSTVCSPISMSHMSQDLVRNHMKSHYQRINSAKACVDTSAPKSLKLTIKEKDRKRREALRSPKTTPRPQSQGNNTTRCEDPEQEILVNSGNGYHYQSILKHSFREDSPSNELSSLQRKKHESSGGPSLSIPRESNVLKGDLRDSKMSIDCNGYTQYERTSRNNRSQQNRLIDDQHLSRTTNQSLDMNDLNGKGFDRQYTSTPRFETEHVAPEDVAMSRISFSYKEPPSTRRKTKKRSEEIIWTEEQKYLNFISEVTNDVLARGIFSNRVLNRVFESHIEKKKEELDEEHMREMIDQLKEDLGVTV